MYKNGRLLKEFCLINKNHVCKHGKLLPNDVIVKAIPLVNIIFNTEHPTDVKEFKKYRKAL
jgi:hypothetical protein